MRAEEIPDPLLKAIHLLAKAAPFSDTVSLELPAFGKVNDTVDVLEAVSVTIVNPFDSVVTEALLASDGVGVTLGSL